MNNDATNIALNDLTADRAALAIFESRIDALIPAPLTNTYILDELHDTFPELTLENRDLITLSTPTDQLADAIRALTDNDLIELICSYTADALIDALNDDDDPMILTLDDARAIMTFAERIDPTASNIAAAIRDTIRDNTELSDF